MKPFISALLVLVLLFSLAGCSATSAKAVPAKQATISSSESPVSSEIAQSEIDAKLKSKAVKADFVKINGKEWKDKEVFAEGKISNVDVKEPMITFDLTLKGDKGIEMYKIVTFKTLPNVADITEGDSAKIYGTVGDPDNDGIPKILVTIVENSI